MGQVMGELTGTNAAARDGIAAQQAGAAASNETQKYMYDTTRADNEAYRAAGQTALAGMQDPSLTSAYSMDQYKEDPAYAFQLAEGQKALERSAAAKGGVMNGATLKALSSYGQNTALGNYQTLRSNFNEDQNSRFGKLSTLAGMGQGANSANQAAGSNYANNVSATQQGLGNATAAAGIGAANANAQMLGQAAGTAAMAFSDERLKQNVEAISKEDMREFKQNLRALKFDYTHEVFGPKDFYGVMAQDLEKSKLGRTIVVEDEFGNKKIDPKRAMSLFLASMAEG